MSRPGPPPLLLLGPTASGKSALALGLAQRVDLEIVSVDSAQVYRGLDIGTAKPDARERAQVAHHLIDIREPTEAYSAAEFVRDARGLIERIRARGRLPLLVGGTMLYARSLVAPLDDLPSADPAIRARIDAEAAEHGWPALHARLAAHDPVAAARIGSTDPQRIQRALEVIALTGRPLSELQSAGTRPAAADAAIPILALEPADRAVLHRRIAERFDRMLAQGFVDEVARLRARPGLGPDLPAMRAVGYRQAWACLAGEQPMDALRETGIAATRQLAKRQLTWLRGLARAHAVTRLDCLRPDLLTAALPFVDAHCRR